MRLFKRQKKEELISVSRQLVEKDLELAKLIKMLCGLSKIDKTMGMEAQVTFGCIESGMGDIVRHLETYLKDEA